MKEPLERIQAVQIMTGEVREVAVRPRTPRGITSVWFPESLRKDGQPPKNRYWGDGQIAQEPDYSSLAYASVDAGREEKASLERRDIARLRKEVHAAEARLIALYTEEAT